MIRFLTAGESHGPGLLIIVEGVPAGLPLTEEYIGIHLTRRQKGYGRGGRMLIEKDWAHITSGVRHGKTLGSPIGMTLENKDWVNWQEPMSIAPIEGEAKRVTRIRPGHADLPGTMKYGFDDVRNVLERASARETAARVSAGAVALRFLRSSIYMCIATPCLLAASGPARMAISTGRRWKNRRCGPPILKLNR